jgi:hypothetical protein
LQKAIHEFGDVAERVFELVVVGRSALAESRIVRCDHMIAIGEQRDEIAEHVRRRWETVHQNKCGRVGGPSFAVEDVRATDVLGPIMHDRNLHLDDRRLGSAFSGHRRGGTEAQCEKGAAEQCGGYAHQWFSSRDVMAANEQGMPIRGVN